MDAMGVDAFIAQQAKAVIHAQVARILRIQLAHPSYFLGVLAHMRLNPYLRILCGQLAHTAHLRVRAGGCEARRNRVAQLAARALAMPALDQAFGIDQ